MAFITLSKKGKLIIAGLMTINLLLIFGKLYKGKQKNQPLQSAGFSRAAFTFPKNVLHTPFQAPLITPPTQGKFRVILKTGKYKVRLDAYNPGGTKKPIAILLHGAAGIESVERAKRYERFATELMEDGNLAINVYYFDCPQTHWLTAIVHAISQAQHILNVDKQKVSLIGYSLGGSLAMVVAAHDRRVTRLAIAAGYRPSEFTDAQARRLPDTFFETGDQDPAINTLRFLKDNFVKNKNAKLDFFLERGYGHSMPLAKFWQGWERIRRFVNHRPPERN